MLAGGDVMLLGFVLGFVALLNVRLDGLDKLQLVHALSSATSSAPAACFAVSNSPTLRSSAVNASYPDRPRASTKPRIVPSSSKTETIGEAGLGAVTGPRSSRERRRCPCANRIVLWVSSHVDELYSRTRSAFSCRP